MLYLSRLRIWYDVRVGDGVADIMADMHYC